MTELETPAVTPAQDSAPAAETPAFDAGDQHTWSPAQREEWNKTGTQPTKQDSAPAKKEDKAVADSAPPDKDKKDKPAATASDSATDSSQKPHLKTKEDTEKRIKEFIDENKSLKQRLEALEREKTQPTRETKQESHPAVETYKPLDEKEFFKANPKASYEDFVRAAGRHEGVWASRQEIAAENQRRAVAEAQKDLASKLQDARTRYPDYDSRIAVVAQALNDEQIPFPVRATINDSPVFADLVYVLGDPAALRDFVATAKSNPSGALRKVVLTEQLIQAELAKAKSGKDAAAGKDSESGTERDASGKFVKKEEGAPVEPKPRAPKPPSEVGGRGTAPEDALRTAAEKNDFRSFEAEQNRRTKARANA